MTVARFVPAEPWAPTVEATTRGPGAALPMRRRDLFASAGPVARAVVLHGFVDEGEAPAPPLWAAECRILGEQRLAATARRYAHDRNIDLPAKVNSFLLDAEFAWAAITIDSVESSRPAL